MGAVWGLMQAAAPYVKIIEYAVIIATLIASIYASRKIRASAREIKEVMHASSEDLRQEVQEISRGLEDDFKKIVDQLREDLAAPLAAADVRQDQSTADNEQGSNSTHGTASGSPKQASAPRRIGKHEAHRLWWQPVVDVAFDNAQQEKPRLYWSNNVRTRMPWPETWLTAWRNISDEGVCGVALSGTEEAMERFWRAIRKKARRLEAELPKGSSVARGRFGIRITKPNAEFSNDDERRAWIAATLNRFVNILRPYMEVANAEQMR